VYGKKIYHAGRNNEGIISVRHKGSQVKRLFRIINFKFFYWNIYGIVIKFCYDPNRTAPLVLICAMNGILFYQVASINLKLGGVLFLGNKPKNITKKHFTFSNFISNFAEGNLVNNMEFKNLKGSQVVRSAGCFGQILKIRDLKVLVRLPSKEERFFAFNIVCVIGQIANTNHFLLSLSKAGRNRLLGVRPCVRGVAMNPVDHPHGGGQGKTSGAGGFRSQVTFKGKVAKTQPTRKKVEI